MGMEGKARGMLCQACSSPELTCLSRLAPAGRALCWYCPSCRRCCDYAVKLSLYDKVPWPSECVTGYPRVPGGAIPDAYRLRRPIGWEDFLKHLKCMANRKASGDDMVVAELWKNAPEWGKNFSSRRSMQFSRVRPCRNTGVGGPCNSCSKSPQLRVSPTGGPSVF